MPIHYDRIDRQQTHKVMVDLQCFWGNVSSGMLVTGTPEQVRDDVKELIDLFGPSGSLILDGNLGIPDEARPENLDSIRETVATFGVS